MKSKYQQPIDADNKTMAIERAYENLEDSEQQRIDNIRFRLMNKVKKLGDKGSLELIGKLGMVLAEAK